MRMSTLMLGLVVLGLNLQAAEESKGDRERAIAEIKRLGREVVFEDSNSRNAAVQVNLNNTKATDETITRLKGLKELRWLYLANTQVTDGGLENLKAFPELEQLALYRTSITDAGLVHLQALSDRKSTR